MLFLLSIVVFSMVGFTSVDSIRLPPFPKKDDSSIMGVDVNKNYVRDDIEHLIFNKISKDPTVFKIFLNYSESYSLALVYVKDGMKRKFYHQQYSSDFMCIARHPATKDMLSSADFIGRSIVNSKVRKQASFELGNLVDYNSLKTPKGLKVCRF